MFSFLKGPDVLGVDALIAIEAVAFGVQAPIGVRTCSCRPAPPLLMVALVAHFFRIMLPVPVFALRNLHFYRFVVAREVELAGRI